MGPRICTALLSALLAVCSAVPSAAFAPLNGVGHYTNVRFANTTDWCVWFTVWGADYTTATFARHWKFITAQNVPPHKSTSIAGPTEHPKSLSAGSLRIKAELYKHGNCSGSTVGSQEIMKNATQPKDMRSIKFGAVSQLDYGGGKFNMYWGEDSVLSSALYP
jgi:hypothetical protein